MLGMMTERLEFTSDGSLPDSVLCSKPQDPCNKVTIKLWKKKPIPNENFSGRQATLDSPQYLLPHVQRGKKRTSSMCGWSGLFSCVVDLQCTEAKSPSVVGTKTENDFEMEDLKSRTFEDLEPGILRRISRPYHRRLVTILYLTFFLWPLSSVNICPHYEIW